MDTQHHRGGIVKFSSSTIEGCQGLRGQLGPDSSPPPPSPLVIADALLAPYRYEAQPLTEEILLEEQQRAEAMLQAASDGIAPTAQNLPHGQPGEYLALHVSAALSCNHTVIHILMSSRVELLPSYTILMTACSWR